MAKRMIIMLAAVLVLVAVLAFVKYQQIQAAIAGAAGWTPPPEAVTTVTAQQENWEATLDAIGSMTAVQGVTVSADLPGIVSKITFESGKPVARGAVLVELDTKQEQAQLAAAEAERDVSRISFDRMRELRGRGVAAQAELDDAEARLKSAEARVGEIRATIERKTIRAPFPGMLGIRLVNLGQYLNSGEPIVSLQSLDPIYVDFTVPQQDLVSLSLGTIVTVHSDGPDGVTVTGPITAIDSVVDESTRNARIQATVPNPEGLLRPGMFVETRILLGGGSNVVAIPASSVSYAPYGDSVFIVEELKGPDGSSYLGVRQQFVKITGARGDQVALSSGVEAGEEVVSSGVFKLRNGAAVQVNNSVQPSNDPAPVPENS